MNVRYAIRDFTKNKGVNIALFVVLVLSAFLMATGSMVMERMFGSVNALFDEAKPPHFLQMHKGDYDLAALDGFAAEHPEIDQWLITNMVGFDSAALTWERPSTGESGSFSESLVDNLFTVQNESFDLLLDENSDAPRPTGAEVYVPVAYQQQFQLQAGDVLRVQTASGIEEFTISGFVRDAQMASSLSASTRFIISDAAFASLESAGGGTPEIIVEYRLTDPSLANQFQTAYESDDALPKNGQAVTFEMIRIINAISDGLVAVALIFVSVLLIVIALINVRFVIRGTLQDEVREICAMKAIGLPNSTISGLYLSKYSIMTLLACVLGGVLAIFATDALTRNVQANYAPAPVTAATVIVPVVSLVVVFVIVISICRGVLNSIKRIEVVSALVHGSTLNEKQTARRAKRRARRVRRSVFTSYRGGDINRRLAMIDLRAEARQWVLIPIVFLLATVLVTLPTNLLTTFESPKFVTYMGAPEADLRFDLQFSGAVDSERAEVLAVLEDDDRIASVQTFANVLYESEGDEGWETLRVEVGDYSNNTVQFTDGGAPNDGEIALSALNAEKFSIGVDDTITVRQEGEAIDLTVSGVYQDVTSGGYTAKLQGDVMSGAVGYVIYANTVGGVDPATAASEFGDQFEFAAVVPMAEYVQQTLSYVTDAFSSAAIIALAFALGVAVLITCLYLNLQLARDRRTLGSLSVVGFAGGELASQLRLKSLVSVVIGTALGVIVSATLGQSLVGGAISLAGLGISSLTFIPNPWLVYLAYPLLIIAAGYVSAAAISNRIRRADVSAWLRD